LCSPDIERAIFAGGRFWGLQSLFRRYPNVLQTRVGYCGGDTPNPTYRAIGSHAEAVEVYFDPEKPGYRRLLEFFFQIHDPTTANRQGHDSGPRYRSAIFYTTDHEQRIAIETIAAMNASCVWPGPVVTAVLPAGPFWPAEPLHQDYLDHHPCGYKSQFIRPGWTLPTRSAGLPKGEDDPSTP
jgi:peptide-methionine (S)-S-oxide reductase